MRQLRVGVADAADDDFAVEAGRSSHGLVRRDLTDGALSLVLGAKGLAMPAHDLGLGENAFEIVVEVTADWSLPAAPRLYFSRLEFPGFSLPQWRESSHQVARAVRFIRERIAPSFALVDSNRYPGVETTTPSDECGRPRRGWCHAFACLSGRELADIARVAGAAVYVGYDAELVVCSGEGLPHDLQIAFGSLVTATTFALAGGVREERELRASASRAADELCRVLAPLSDDVPALL